MIIVINILMQGKYDKQLNKIAIKSALTNHFEINIFTILKQDSLHKQ